ncbi:MAG TPA: hypothetical protein VNL16_04730 [Chloroflexota bacterium]|nr:hypothetical protein [Chloroflexota bacterium]
MAANAAAASGGASHDMMAMARRVGVGGMIAGLVGGVAMIGLMIIVMGAQGSGYASPLNLGIPAFVKTITPPMSMFPTLMGMMGIHLSAAAMAQVGPAFASGHLTPAVMTKLSTMLMAMHVPAAKLHVISALMGGHATNSMMANMLSGMSPSARSAVMSAMPVTAGHVVIGAITHFVLAMILGMVFAMMIIGVGIGRLDLAPLRTPAGIVAASVLGAAVVYVVNRWIILPAIDPMMRLVPEGWFLISHLLFGAVVGLGIVMVASREGVLESSHLRTVATA